MHAVDHLFNGQTQTLAHELIAAVEALAGPERADSISERIAMLLPPETQA